MKNIYTFVIAIILILNFHPAFSQNVGIGTSTPDTKLEIIGDDENDLLDVKDHQGNSRMYIENAGNVGIGTVNPVTKLDVNGGLRAYGKSGVKIETVSVEPNTKTVIKWENIDNSVHATVDVTVFIEPGNSTGTERYVRKRFFLSYRGGHDENFFRAYNSWIVESYGGNGEHIGEFEYEGSASDGYITLSIYHGHNRNTAIYIEAIGQNTDFIYDYDLESGVQAAFPGNQNTAQISPLNHFHAQRSLFIDENLGVGTTSPTARMDVDGLARIRSLSGGGLVRADNEGYLSTGATVDWSEIDNLPTIDNSKWNQTGNHIHNKNSGNVGIGTANPNERLTVRASGFGGNNYISFERTDHAGGPSEVAIHGYAADAAIAFNPGSGHDWGMGVDRNGQDFHISADRRIDLSRLVTITRSGNLGVNTESPGQRLHVNGNSILNGITFIGGTGFQNPDQNSVVRIPVQGNAGEERNYIELQGVHANDAQNENGGAFIKFRTSTAAGYGPEIGGIRRSGGNGDFIIKTGGINPQERFRVLNNGNVGINNSNPSYRLHVTGRIKSDGITESSDVRLKYEIETLQDALYRVLQLRGVSYNWNNKAGKELGESGTKIGLIAQEVEKILPEVVDTDNDGYKSVQYSVLVALLIEALKEQQHIINEKDEKINSLEQNVEVNTDNIQQIISAIESAGIQLDLKVEK